MVVGILATDGPRFCPKIEITPRGETAVVGFPFGTVAGSGTLPSPLNFDICTKLAALTMSEMLGSEGFVTVNVLVGPGGFRKATVRYVQNADVRVGIPGV